MVNEPFLKVELEALPSDAYEGELQTDIHSARQKVSTDAGRKSLYILHPDFADASRCPAITCTTVTPPTSSGRSPRSRVLTVSNCSGSG